MIAVLMLALLGFVVSVAVHVSTFAGSHAVSMSQAWPLHIGMCIVLLPLMVGQRRDRAKADQREGSSDEHSSYVPRWMGAVLGVCAVYAFVFFGLFIAGEVLRPRDGRIGMDEARQVRACSAIWMIVYAAAVAGLYSGLARRRAARAALPAFPALPASIRHTNRYERGPAPRMSPWAHATVGAILSLVGFFALPMGVAALFLSAKPSGAGWIVLIAPVFFGAAVVGLKLPGALMSRYVAAACPACGGRAYADGGPLGADDRDVRYTCRDCGRVCAADGGVAEPDGEPGNAEMRGS